MTDTTFAGESRPASPSPIHVEQMQLDLLAADPDQIRKHFDQDALQSLAESIKTQGLIQPIVVRPDGEGGQHKIIAGERRFRAARLAGIESVPVIVREDLAGADVSVIQVIENLQREDLSLAETCAGVAKLVEQIGFQKTCEQLGKSEAWVSKHAGVVKLPDPIKKLVGEGKIESVDVAKDLGSLYELSPKKAENLLQRLAPEAGARDYVDPDSEDDGDDDDLSHPNRTVWVNGVHKKVSELTADEAEAHRLRSGKWHDRNRPTRSEIRLELVEAKVQKQRSIERREERKAEAAEAKADPKKAKKVAAEKAKQERERERVKAIENYNEAARSLGYELTKKLNVAAGFKEPTRSTYRWNGDVCIEVDPEHLSSYGQTKAPSAPIEGKFNIDANGTFAEIDKAAKLLKVEKGFAPRFHGELTIVEAKKIADILGSRIRFGLRVHGTGTQIQQYIERGSKPAAGNKAAAASSADATVQAFLEARVRKATIPSRRVKASELHDAYTAWCKPLKHKAVALTSNAWGAAIEAAGIEKVRSGGVFYLGIELVKG